MGHGVVMTANVEPFMGNWALKYCINGRKIALELRAKAKVPNRCDVKRSQKQMVMSTVHAPEGFMT